jgi:hypothetical protein
MSAPGVLELQWALHGRSGSMGGRFGVCGEVSGSVECTESCTRIQTAH